MLMRRDPKQGNYKCWESKTDFNREDKGKQNIIIKGMDNTVTPSQSRKILPGSIPMGANNEITRHI